MTTQPPSIAKPVAVTRAIDLLCFSLGIFFGYSLWRSFYDSYAIRDMFFSLIPMAWLTYKTNQGRNWARITFLALYVSGIVISIPLLLTDRDSINSIISAAVVGAFIVQVVLQAIALFMLFSRDARLWFRAVSNQPPVHVTGNLEYRRLVLLGISGAMISYISLVVLIKATEAQYSENKIGEPTVGTMKESKIGKQIVSAMNRTQQAFFLQENKFSSDFSALGLGLDPETPYYSYKTQAYNSGKSSYAISTATPKQDGLKSYVGGAFVTTNYRNEDTTVSILCGSTQPSASPPSPPKLVGRDPQCASGSTALAK